MKARITLFTMALAFLAGIHQLNAQAALFKDLEPGSVSGTPEQFTVVNNTMYFISVANFKRSLWKSDGTVAGTVVVKDDVITTNVIDRFMIRGYIGDTLYYSVNNSVQWDTTTELWMTTGSAPVLMATLTSKMVNGYANGEPRQYTVAGDKLYFQMHTDHGYELWVCDGSTAGTKEVTDIFPGGGDGVNNVPMMGYNGKIYFAGTTTLGPAELYASDGTAAGTALVKPSMLNCDPTSFFVFNNALYFYADDGTNDGTWKTDGTANGTVFVHPAGFNPTVKLFQNKMYFSVNNSLWKSDGTTAGTELVRDTLGLVMGILGNSIYTMYMKPIGVAPYVEYYFYKLDGTAASIVRVSDSLGKAASTIVLNGKMYSASTGLGLWETDGTEAGTRELVAGYVNYPTAFNNTIFFSNHGAGTGYELWSFAPGGGTGIEEEQTRHSGLNVYPNPSTGIFKIVGAANEDMSIQVFNILGEEVEQSNSNILDLSGRAKGAYFIKVQSNNKIYCQKILIQ